MIAEQEVWLIQQLREGIEVKELFPHIFYMRHVYYHITVHGKKISFVLEMEKEKLDQNMKMRITKVFQIVRGEKEEVKDTILTSKEVAFKPAMTKLTSKDTNPFLLTGKIFLQ